MKKFFSLIFAFSVYISAFASPVVSPVEGSFSNRQLLAINLKPGEEAYYSYAEVFNPADPMESGFVYDGPVLIDAGGKVNLKVAVVSKESVSRESEADSETLEEKIQYYEVKYSVSAEKNIFEADTPEYNFVQSVLENRILVCDGLKTVDIPPSLEFCLGDGDKPFISGTQLSVSSDNCLFRYIPCTVVKDNFRIRFLISVLKDDPGIDEERDVPFKITDWYTLQFTGKNLIWSLDNGLWSASREPVFLDRSVKHTVSYQSVAYSRDNPVESFDIPPKPALKKEFSDRKAVFYLEGDRNYRMKVISGGSENEITGINAFYPRVVFDVFEGDSLEGNGEFAVYYDGIYQGKFYSEYKIDKQPPLPPVFDSGDNGFYARSAVDLQIHSEKDSQIYVSMAGPLVLKDGVYNEASQALKEVKTGEFGIYNGEKIHLRPGKTAAVFYKFTSYCVDQSGNKSALSTYNLIIDQFNYFIDFGSPFEKPDGSRSRPFNSIKQITDVINSSSYTHFFVTGDFNLDENTEITSNCSFTGNSRAKINFGAGAVLTVKDASIDFSNCYFEKEYFGGEKSSSQLIKLKNAAASFNDCHLLAKFSDSGTALFLEDSLLKLKNSFVTVQSPSYGACVAGTSSEIEISGGQYLAQGETSVVLTVGESSVDVKNASCTIKAQLGRICEATASNLKFADNKFTAYVDSQKNPGKSIYMDSKSLLLEYSHNTEEGF